MKAVLGLAVLLVVALSAWWMVSDSAGRRGQDWRSRDVPAMEAGNESAELLEPGDDAGDGERADNGADQCEPRTFQVVDEEGEPVADAWIDVYPQGRTEEGARDRVRTGGMGYATLRLLDKDELVAGAKGFARTRVERPLRPRRKRIVLRQGYRIAGVVVDPGGAPIEGALVRTEESCLHPLQTRTGPHGRFELARVAGDETTLRVEAAGFLDDRSSFDPGDLDVRIVLFRARDAFSIRGRVLLEDGSPASGAHVNSCVTTDAEGRFELTGLRPGFIGLWAALDSPERSRRAHVTVRLAPDGTHPPVRLILEAKPRSWVRVRILDKSGAPAKGLRVCGGSMARVPLTETDAEGRALCIFDLPAGTETFLGTSEYRRDGLLPARAVVVTAPPPGGDEVVLRPREAVPVTVIARDPDGERLPPTVRAFIAAGGMPAVHRERDRATFALDPAVGNYLVKADAWGYGHSTAWIKTPRPPWMEIRLHRTGTLRCRLADATGWPVRDGFVWVLELGSHRHAESDEATAGGSYLVPDVQAGRVRVTAGRNDLPGARVEAVVRPGEETDLGTLVLRAPLVLTGRVTDVRGRRVGGAHVTALEGDDETARTYSHADGSFRLRCPPWFAGYLLAQKRGRGAAQALVEPHVELVLPPEGRVRLSVRLESTARTRAWSLAVRDPRTGFQWSPDDMQWIASDTVLVGGLPPGRLILVVWTTPHDAEVEVDVVAGETIPATLVVRD